MVIDVGIQQKNYFDKLDTRSKKEGRKDLKGVVCRRPSSSSVGVLVHPRRPSSIAIEFPHMYKYY